jgi:hypothetical protein
MPIALPIVSQIMSDRRDQRAVKSLVAMAPAMKHRKPTRLKVPMAASLPTLYLK